MNHPYSNQIGMSRVPVWTGSGMFEPDNSSWSSCQCHRRLASGWTQQERSAGTEERRGLERNSLPYVLPLANARQGYIRDRQTFGARCL